MKGFTGLYSVKAQLGLSNSYSRAKVKFNVNKFKKRARTVPRKSPAGTTLKFPGCLKSPSTESPGKSSTPTVSPGSLRSPMISPGGKPTYLLAHMLDKAASREAEKIQEREMQKRESDKVSKDGFKTKKDVLEASTKKSEDSSTKLSKTKEERALIEKQRMRNRSDHRMSESLTD